MGLKDIRYDNECLHEWYVSDILTNYSIKCRCSICFQEEIFNR